MLDIWGFLLQTLTASSVALIVITIKHIFKDTLSPKWHFAIWSIAGIFTLVPASLKGTFILFNEGFILELFKNLAGEYKTTSVFLPFPVISSLPKTTADYIFWIYALGVTAHLTFYAVSYARLKAALKKYSSPSDEARAVISEAAARAGIKSCKAYELDTISTPFVCGVFKPILVIPKKTPDIKVIYHELIHLKNRDTLWSIIACVIRSIHWCNPFIVHCANTAICDMERRCDQYVLEGLDGEERREYGHLLLSAANMSFTKTPGTTCISNGGKNIKKRIETIAKFKLYPKGMRLVAVCIAAVLFTWFFTGTNAAALKTSGYPKAFISAAAKSTPCTTYAGAFDAYASAVSRKNGYYRMMCASDELKAELSEKANKLPKGETELVWDSGFPLEEQIGDNYAVMNLEKLNSKSYKGTMLFCLRPGFEEDYPLTKEEKEALEINENSVPMRFATQTVVVKKEGGRWIAEPCEDFKIVYSRQAYTLWDCTGLPAVEYTAACGDILIKTEFQTLYGVIPESRQSTYSDAIEEITSYNNPTFLPTFCYSSKRRPNPKAKFKHSASYDKSFVTSLSDDTKDIESIGLSTKTVYKGEEYPYDLKSPELENGDGRFDKNNYSSREINKGELSKNKAVSLGGGGNTNTGSAVIELPEYFAAELFVNKSFKGDFNLTRETEAEK